MSNTATLMVRLRVGLMASAAFVRGNSDREVRMTDAIDALEEVEARIAELEATLAQERRTYASVAEQLKARIAELEAEVARLTVAFDRYGIALRMIEHGCASPARLAGETIKAGGDPPKTGVGTRSPI